MIKGFLPWILYSVFYGNTPKQFMIAILAALISSLIFNFKEIKKKFILTSATLIYFALLLILTLLFHWSWLRTNAWLISNLVLTAIAFGSVVIKQPFTIQYAKLITPEIFWKTPLFLQINNILTNIWGAIFLFTALTNFIYIEDPHINSVLYFVINNIGWVIGAYVSKKFPNYWKNKKMQKHKPNSTEKSVSRYLEGNFAPLRTEDNFDHLEIIGKIPDDLNGVLLRNGPNPQFDPIGAYHWFEGDGMLHAIRIQNGSASYDNRWIKTPRFMLENKAGKPLFGADLSDTGNVENTESGTANTNIIAYHEKFLALNEGESPFEINLKDLSAVGSYTFDEQIKRRLTAHPRIDPDSKEFITYSYIGEDEKLMYYRLDNQNKLIVEKEIKWPYAAMMHDFVNTQNYVIFPIFPCTMSFARMMRGENIFMWEGDKLNTFFIITNKMGDEIARVETDPCHAYHFGNAYEDGENIIIDAMVGKRVGLMPDRFGKIGDAHPRLGRWTINLKTKSIVLNYLDETVGEFPRFDERSNGKPYQHLYVCGQVKPSDDAMFDRIMHYDLKNNIKTEHHFGNNVPWEPVFVAKSEKEGDGYLLTVVYRTAENRSDLVILDANNIAAEPIAIIKIPHRIPYGFHGNFMRIVL